MISLDAPDRGETYSASDSSVTSCFLNNGKRRRLFQIYDLYGPVDEREPRLHAVILALMKWKSMSVPGLQPYRPKALKVFFQKTGRSAPREVIQCPGSLRPALESVTLTEDYPIAALPVTGPHVPEIERLLRRKTSYSRNSRLHFALRLHEQTYYVSYRPLLPWENYAVRHRYSLDSVGRVLPPESYP